MSPAQYQTANASVSVPVAQTWVRIIGGDPQRVQLVWSSTLAAFDLSPYDRGPSSTDAIVINLSTFYANMLRREWGPIVTGELFVRSRGIAGTVSLFYVRRIR